MIHTYKDLIANYEFAKAQMEKALHALKYMPDGFRYITKERSYGSIYWQSHINEYCASLVDNGYNGDNGIVEIYTNNPKITITNYSGGGIYLLSEVELDNIRTKDTNMGEAIANKLINAILPDIALDTEDNNTAQG